MPTPRPALAIPAHVLPHRTPRELLLLSRQGLAEARGQRRDGMRYAAAHLAALRAAAAVLVAKAIPTSRRSRGRVTNVWELLTAAAPEFRDWAAFFATSAKRRTAAQAGITRAVTARDADHLLRAADQFVGLVEICLGLSPYDHIEAESRELLAS